MDRENMSNRYMTHPPIFTSQKYILNLEVRSFTNAPQEEGGVQDTTHMFGKGHSSRMRTAYTRTAPAKPHAHLFTIKEPT